RAALTWAQEIADSGTMLRLVTALRPSPPRWNNSVAPSRVAEHVELGDLVVRELEPEHVEVLGDPVGIRRLGDDDDVVLEVPADHDLRRRDAVSAGDPHEPPVGEARRLERAVALDLHAPLAARGKRRLVVTRGAPLGPGVRRKS